MKYVCNICKYSTEDKSNYNKHIKSDNHKENIITKFICEDCNKQFSYASGLSRHRKTCKNIKLINNENNALKQTVEEYKNLLEQYKILLQNNNNNKQTTNKTYISINYIQQNYGSAPIIHSLDDYSSVKLLLDNDDIIDELSDSEEDYNSSNNKDINNKFDKTDKEFMILLINKYKSNTLHEYLGDFLIKYYKKDDPKQQSIWNSDAVRLTYFVNELLANNTSCWTRDKKGIKTKNYIITPLLKYIQDFNMKSLYYLNYKNCYVSYKKGKEIIKYIVTISNIQQSISDGVIANNIIKYIAPYFDINNNIKLISLSY